MNGFNPRPACGAKGGFIPEKTERDLLFQSAPRVRGERIARKNGKSTFAFQSAPRVRGERQTITLLGGPTGVSIRAPRAGRKVARSECCRSSIRFNPRPACGAKVSTRRPLRPTRCFNPRPACGAKGTNAIGFGTNSPVSIRAPRAGRKKKLTAERASILTFQSAPRVRGESTQRKMRLFSATSFNPRPACGAKGQGGQSYGDSPSRVSIRAPRAGRKVLSRHFSVRLSTFQSAPRVRGERKTQGNNQLLPTFQSAPRVRGESDCGADG